MFQGCPFKIPASSTFMLNTYCVWALLAYAVEITLSKSGMRFRQIFDRYKGIQLSFFYAMTAYRESRGMALLMLNLDII